MNYSKTKKQVKDLKLNHDMVQAVGLPEINEFLALESKHFNCYEIPIITPDNIVLTHFDAVLSAMKNQKETIDVVVVDGFDKDELPRFINYGLFTKNLNHDQRYRLVKFLRDHLKNNPKGIEWAKEIKGKDINEKVGIIINRHKETVKQWHGHFRRKANNSPINKTLFKKSGFAPHRRPVVPGQENDYGFFEFKHLSFKIEEIQEDMMTKERISISYRGYDLNLKFEHKFQLEANSDFLNFYNSDDKLVVQIMLNDIYTLVNDANNKYHFDFEEQRQMKKIDERRAKGMLGVPLISDNQENLAREEKLEIIEMTSRTF